MATPYPPLDTREIDDVTATVVRWAGYEWQALTEPGWTALLTAGQRALVLDNRCPQVIEPGTCASKPVYCTEPVQVADVLCQQHGAEARLDALALAADAYHLVYTKQDPAGEFAFTHLATARTGLLLSRLTIEAPWGIINAKRVLLRPDWATDWQRQQRPEQS